MNSGRNNVHVQCVEGSYRYQYLIEIHVFMYVLLRLLLLLFLLSRSLTFPSIVLLD